ncbi:MAG: PH domain-containing protein [Bacteroidaceae bacterium]|nr:PH domain-containing protein [Bacteroidaceae bacterium]
MGYIQNNLMDDEKIVYEAKLHDIVYTGPIILAIFSFLIVFSLLDTVSLIISFIIWSIAVGWAISIYGGKQYVVTTHRLIFKRGIINRDSFELLLRKCEGIQVDQSILGRILDYGTVNVTTGEATNSYKYISHPLRFSTKIHEQIFNLKDL